MLEKLGIPLKIVVSNCDETFPEDVSISDAVQAVATRKALAIQALDSDWVLAADTVVVLGDRLLGKPANAADAASMLGALSGQTHRVLTAVALAHAGTIRSLAVTTEVRFRRLTAGQINWYVASAEPMDKAGGYAIQGLAAPFIEKINGSYTNVVGLPLAETMDLLEAAGFTPWSATPPPELAASEE
jgi:septum formation protein